MHTEEIIKEVGGMSNFQIFMMALIFGPKLMMAWGMLLMSFAGTVPDWWCVPAVPPSTDNQTDVVSVYKNNITYEFCPSSGNSSACRFVFSPDKNTIVNEWNLVCESGKTPAFITSIQMAGVLTGAFLGGQSADTIGRKPTLFLSLLLEGGFNLVAGFSVSWQMFTALRFFIGMMIGSLLVVNYPYVMEFISPKWRPICSAIPWWTTGVCIMALSCWLRPNWAHQHIILAAIHIPFLFGWFIVPESLRWLAVKGRLDDAEKVVDQMCRYNKREKPANTRLLLKKVADEEEKRRESGSKYTYIDIYRGWSICWKSIIVQLIWMCMSLVYYGISFGAGKLSGNLYLNIFLLAVVEIPAAVASFFMNNTIGRRWTCFSFFAMACLGSFGVVITTRVAVSEANKGTIINVLALIAKLGVGAGWGAFQVLTSETYPTVIRNLGYGAANTAARVGGIIAPYIFAMEGDDVMIPFIIVGSTMAACATMTLVMVETKGTPLQDTSAGNVTYTVEKGANDGTDLFHNKNGGTDKFHTKNDGTDIFHTKL